MEKMRTTHLVVKIASRCNLNCTYCYMYNMGDQTYKSQPKFMSEIVTRAMFHKIKNHCQINSLKKFLIIFHGGEPLLPGIEYYKSFIRIEKEIIQDDIEISYAMQSNGVLISKEVALELLNLNIQVGISLDGTPASNNKNRIFHNKKGGYNAILKGFNNIKKIHGKKLANCICVIDTEQDPKEVYTHFKKVGANSVLFLFPDLNFNHSSYDEVPKVGKWLIEIFDLWYHDEDINKPSIRPLRDLIGLILGQEISSEIFGKGINDTLVIETDGSIEPVDTMKICGNGFTKTKFNVLNDELSSIFENSELARTYYYGHQNLCQTCQTCPLEKVCGGGNIINRYSRENNFDNPSIYCKNIIELICHMQNTILSNIPKDLITEMGIDYLSYNEILNIIHKEYDLQE